MSQLIFSIQICPLAFVLIGFENKCNVSNLNHEYFRNMFKDLDLKQV